MCLPSPASTGCITVRSTNPPQRDHQQALAAFCLRGCRLLVFGAGLGDFVFHGKNTDYIDRDTQLFVPLINTPRRKRNGHLECISKRKCRVKFVPATEPKQGTSKFDARQIAVSTFVCPAVITAYRSAPKWHGTETARQRCAPPPSGGQGASSRPARRVSLRRCAECGAHSLPLKPRLRQAHYGSLCPGTDAAQPRRSVSDAPRPPRPASLLAGRYQARWLR